MSLLSKPLALLKNGEAFGKKKSTVTIHRAGKGDYKDGYPVTKPGTSFSLLGSIQPVTGKDKLLETGGDRVREHIYFYTTGDVRADDTIEFDCKNFRVLNLEDWGPYRRALAVVVDVISE